MSLFLKRSASSANTAKHRLITSIAFDDKKGVVTTLSRTGSEGGMKRWRLTDGYCPQCGGFCTVKVAVTPNTPSIIQCTHCGGSEGG